MQVSESIVEDDNSTHCTVDRSVDSMHMILLQYFWHANSLHLWFCR